MLSKVKARLLKNGFETMPIKTDFSNETIGILAFLRTEVFILANKTVETERKGGYFLIDKLRANVSEIVFYENIFEIDRFINKVLSKS